MQLEAIITHLLAAAAFLKRPFQSAATESVKDLYEAIKTHLRKKFGAASAAAQALELATAKPESLMRKALLAEETAAAVLETDSDLARLVERLTGLMPQSARPEVHIAGNSNHVQVAGRDLIRTERIVYRNAITPDERHLSLEQRQHVRAMLAELAVRLDGEAPGGIAVAHAMLQRRFQVHSYLLIPRERYAEVMAYLRQQRAIHRSRLQRFNPVAYRNDFLRAIWTRAGKLGWGKSRVRAFAAEKLGLTKPLASLNELGPVQLKSLAERLRQAARIGSNPGRIGKTGDPIFQFESPRRQPAAGAEARGREER